MAKSPKANKLQNVKSAEKLKVKKGKNKSPKNQNSPTGKNKSPQILSSQIEKNETPKVQKSKVKKNKTPKIPKSPMEKNKSPNIPKSPQKLEVLNSPKTPKNPKRNKKSPKSLEKVINKSISKPGKNNKGEKVNKKAKKEKNALKTKAVQESLAQTPSAFKLELAALKEQSKKAFEAVLKFTEKKKSDSLFPDLASRISLNILCFKTPSVDMEFFNIRLPHALYSQSSDVVLVIKHDKKGQEDYQESELKSALYKQKLLTEHGVKVREVITLQQLRNDFSTYEARKAFIKRIDALLVDKSIVKHVPGILGREMYRKKVFPMPVSLLEGRDVAKEIEVALRKTVLHVSTKGNTSNVVIGTDELSSDQLVENLVKICQSLKLKFPGGWNNVSKLSVEVADLPPLVIHFATGGLENVKKSVKKSRGTREIVEDEISTQLNKRVRIHPDGRIDVTTIKDSD